MNIIGIILMIAVVVLYGLYCLYIGKKAGYAKREEEFQGNPVTFTIGRGYPVTKVSHTNGKVTIEIYDKKFVIIKD